jgi:glycosyltransferase involved in cell wall biosynthesis
VTGSVLDVCDYGGPYAGNFIPSLIAVGNAVRERLGLDYRCVFSEVARGRGWLADLDAAGIGYDFIDAGESRARSAPALLAVARERRAVLLRSHFTRFDPDCVYAARRLGAAAIWNVHTGNLDWGWKRSLSDVLKIRLLGRLCDRVIAVSEEVGRELREQRGLPARKLRVVHNGIALERFTGIEAKRPKPDEPPVALAFCWTPYRKGADVILEGVAGMPEGERPQLVLVGEDELHEYLGEPPPFVRIVPPAEDVAELFANADVFVSASREEAFSYAIGEAMACGLPVVSSDIRGPAAFFPAPGLITFRNEDPAALRQALSEVLTADRGLGEANRDFVSERFGMDRHVDGVLAVMRELL